MRKGLIVLAVLLGIGVGGYALAHYGGFGYGGWGHMMGPGWGGHMMGPGYGGYCWGNTPGAYEGTGTLTQEDAETIVKNYYIGANPNLKLGKIEDKETHYEAEVVTKDDSLVAKLSIDKRTGWVRPLN